METDDLKLQVLQLEKQVGELTHQLHSVIENYELRLNRVENVAIRLYTNPMEKELRDFMSLIREDMCKRA